ncbi:glycogen/starch/alpha-glucan phosphorylase [bacterium]|nr:glycogen/starch/alpha-glucan phosphorylase [bacterium]
MPKQIDPEKDELFRQPLFDDVRTGLSVDALRCAVCEHLLYLQGRHPEGASLNDIYLAVAYAVRDRMFQRSVYTLDAIRQQPDVKVVCYLSAEFLMGPQLGANLVNLGIMDSMRKALEPLGVNLDDVLDHEEEPGLGNGGLGRLAACYLDSLATLQVPSIGYGIRYEFGIFDQEIRDGWQVEVTDKWLRWGNPWEVSRPDLAVEIKYGGYTETYHDEQGKYRVRWIPGQVVKGVPHDTPVLGFQVQTCNILRLWRAEAVESFDFAAFNLGDYTQAVQEKIKSENISKVLYPNDDSQQGKALRLQQQYFFVSSSLQDMLRIHLTYRGGLSEISRLWAVQLNDTHPAIAVPEMMRLLIDVHDLDWDSAWEITSHTMGYTNHTLLPEALEKWSVDLFRRMLPRHLEIIYEINRRLLETVNDHFPGDAEAMSRMSLIDEQGERYVRMANLACAGSYAINGVAELHTRLLKENVLSDWVSMFPHRFHNITNGITPRRFLLLCNPGLSQLITDWIGDDWQHNLDSLRKLEDFVDDRELQKQWRQVKIENKRDLSSIVKNRLGIELDPDSIFDIQVKRIHEYKRQHLNILHVIALYLKLKNDPKMDASPRTFLFAGKAAPAYRMAKLVIKLINSVADVVNNDPDIGCRIRVVFFPDFNVKNAQSIYPAADVSEQISTAGKEASGTGNMKFSLNGALTIGTLDGANIEIREKVGEENFFLFGLTAGQVMEQQRQGYNPRRIYEENQILHEVIEAISSNRFSNGEPGVFTPLIESLLNYDPFMVLADFQSYVECQKNINALWRDQEAWTRKSILNVARIGYFSSDRSIREYCEKIWKTHPVSITDGDVPAL